MSIDGTRSRNHRIIVTRLGSGWAACEVAEYEDMDWGTDFEQTGIGRYATEAEAIVAAKEWASDVDLPFEVSE